MKRNILDRIDEQSIETNFHLFPEMIGEFHREPVSVSDETATCVFNYVAYRRNGAIGYVTISDLESGLQRVHKVAQVRPEGGGRKISVPSEECF